MIVVDASAILELLLNTTDGARVAIRLFASGETLRVPHLLDVEVAQVLRRYARQSQLESGRGAQALEDLRDLPLIRYPHDLFLSRIWELRHTVTAQLLDLAHREPDPALLNGGELGCWLHLGLHG
jgi:predicted nucleic acid-binding protein